MARPSPGKRPWAGRPGSRWGLPPLPARGYPWTRPCSRPQHPPPVPAPSRTTPARRSPPKTLTHLTTGNHACSRPQLREKTTPRPRTPKPTWLPGSVGLQLPACLGAARGGARRTRVPEPSRRPRRRRSAGLAPALAPLLRPIQQSGPGARGRAATRLRHRGRARCPRVAAPLRRPAPSPVLQPGPAPGREPPLRGRLERGRWRRGTGSTLGPRGNAEGSCAGTGVVLACVRSGGTREFSGTQRSLQKTISYVPVCSLIQNGMAAVRNGASQSFCRRDSLKGLNDLAIKVTESHGKFDLGLAVARGVYQFCSLQC
ncbi:translation initiation factor IF-2-like [Cygnus atratus]|uniref:translation initiation factor IF-2-like n=1 Tax=Cygnus atratus TaxID=8868 RepID=UPI0015D62FBC|nr:translation initiation factor IF-2-like [Cygnus atratus]